MATNENKSHDIARNEVLGNNALISAGAVVAVLAGVFAFVSSPSVQATIKERSAAIGENMLESERIARQRFGFNF